MLKEGYSPAVIQANIGKEVAAGRKPGQAVAIAYSQARMWFQIKHPEKSLPFYLRKAK